MIGEIAILVAVAACGAAQADLSLTVSSGAIAVLGMRLEAPIELIEKHATTLGTGWAWVTVTGVSVAGGAMRCTIAHVAGTLLWSATT